MYGVIGKEVDGNRMAHDLSELDSEADTVHILINSDGGSVSQGLSIVSAILSARPYIHAHVNGIAASMAAVIAISADRVSIQDYGKLMIHDPFFAGKGKEKLSARDMKALDSITDTLRTILSRRGCDKDRIASLMRDETWFSAEEARTAGLADEVVSTPRKDEFSNLSVPELLSRVMSEYQPKKRDKMNEIAKALGLPEDATERQILDAIRTKDKAVHERGTALVDLYMAMGKRNGTVTEKNEERMRRLAAADFELFAETVTETAEGNDRGNEDGILTDKRQAGAETRRFSDMLNKAQARKKGKGKNENGRDWDWYQNHDPEALRQMERDDPERFSQLLDEYENKIM